MKKLMLIASVIGGLSLSGSSFAADQSFALEQSSVRTSLRAANCKKVAKNVTEVCKTYKAHIKSLRTLRKQLRSDDLTAKFANAHIKAVKGVFEAINSKKSKKTVRGKIKAVKDTSKGVMKQLKPLAKEWDNYRAIQKDMRKTKRAFEAAYKAWLGGNSSSSVNCKKVAKNVTEVCKTFKAHRKALNAARKQLKADDLTPKFVRTHIKALNDLYGAVADNKSRKTVRAKIKALEATSHDVIEQLGPLAEKWDNYSEILKNMVITKDAFEKALQNWMTGADDADDFDDAA